MVKRIEISAINTSGVTLEPPVIVKKINIFDKIRTILAYKSFECTDIGIAHMLVNRYNKKHDNKIDGWCYKVIFE